MTTKTIKEALRDAREVLQGHVPSGALDARVLLQRLLQVNPSYLLLHEDEYLTEDVKFQYEAWIEKRKKGMPVAYILGTKEFMGLSFKVSKDTLIPRPDTEICVEEALKVIAAKGYRDILDLCSGSGAIGLSIAKIMEFTNVTLSDINKGALAVSKENAAQLGLLDRVSFLHSDLFEQVEGRFDVIVSNPPYISEKDMKNLDPTVGAYEPTLALYGGVTGLDFYDIITRKAKEHLKDEGMLIVEIGYDQSQEVEKMMIENGFGLVKTVKDLAGLDRVVSGVLIPET